MIIEVLLADDHAIMREALRQLLADQADVRVVAEADNGHAAVMLARKHRPAVIIMDIGMSNLNGIEATRRIKKEIPGTKVIALTMHSEKYLVIEMFKAGASAYLLKDCAFRELIEAIPAVLANKIYISPSLVNDISGD